MARRLQPVRGGSLVGYMILLPIVVALAQLSAQAAGPSRPPPVVTIEIVRPDELRRGSRVAVLVRTDADAFVTVFRIGTGRRLHVIFPASPREAGRGSGGTNFRVPAPTWRLDDHTFVVTGYPGAGDLFAVASADPFDYAELARDGQWDVTVAFSEGLAAGDPYAVALDLVALTLPEGYTDFTYDVVRYLVFHAPLATNATGGATPGWCATFDPEIYGDRWRWIAQPAVRGGDRRADTWDRPAR